MLFFTLDGLPMVHTSWSPATHLGRLRLVSYAEGISYLLLLGIAVPLKYLAGQPQYVRVIGMVHGLLFVLYVFSVIQAKIEYGWPVRTMLLGLLASVIPFAPFVADARLYRICAPHDRSTGYTMQRSRP